MYKNIKREFNKYHNSTINILLHIFTTHLGIYGFINLISIWKTSYFLIVIYLIFILLNIPIYLSICTCSFIIYSLNCSSIDINTCISFICFSYIFQELSHIICSEPTFESSYLNKYNVDLNKMLKHNLLLLPLVQDNGIDLFFKLMKYTLYNYDRIIIGKVNNNVIMDKLGKLYDFNNLPKSTIHYWKKELKNKYLDYFNILQYSNEIINGIYEKFPKNEYSIIHIDNMNDIYICCIETKLNSDKVFYMQHIDGPWGFFPFVSIYRTILAINENNIVRTTFPSTKKSNIMSNGDFNSFDYHREIHVISNENNIVATNRRIVLKFHYCIVPKGLELYGHFLKNLSVLYNTWARNNFLQTINPNTIWSKINVICILVSTFVARLYQQHIGISNSMYLILCCIINKFYPDSFLIMTSFIHYLKYIITYWERDNLSYNDFVRDVIFFKFIAWIQILIKINSFDILYLLPFFVGVSISMIATFRLGKIRTYFGTELKLVQFKKISKFPYGYIPHPMITGQLIALLSLALHPNWFSKYTWLLPTHMLLYSLHCLQEIYDFHKIKSN